MHHVYRTVNEYFNAHLLIGFEKLVPDVPFLAHELRKALIQRGGLGRLDEEVLGEDGGQGGDQQQGVVVAPAVVAEE